MTRARVLVTGGTGFLGRHVVARLAERYEPVVLVRGSEDFGAGVTSVVGDLRGDLSTLQLPQGIEHIVHLAQSSGYREVPEQAEDVFAVNVGGAWKVAELGRQLGIRSLVVASSGSVYANSQVPLVEDAPLAHGGGVYAHSKLAAELVVTPYREFFPVHVLRFFFIYGPRQSPTMLIPRLHQRISDGEPVVLQGEQGFSFNPVYVDDAVTVTVETMTRTDSATLNVAGTDVVTMRALCSSIGELAGRPPVFEVEETDATCWIADTTALGRDLELRSTSVAGGLRKTFGK
jgi:UDP-glucose 4-epimerase